MGFGDTTAPVLSGFGYNPNHLGFTISNRSGTSSLVPFSAAPTPVAAPVPPHLQFSANIIGTTIPLAIGNVRLAGLIGWAEGVTAASTTLDSSFITFAAFYCEPIDKTELVHIKRMWANGTLFYDLDQGGMVIPASMADTQNAVDLRDCISSMEIYQGSGTQLPSPTIVFDEGAENVPAFRGLRYCVFRNFPMFIAGNNVPNISIEWERDDLATLYVDETIIALGACRNTAISVTGPLHIPHSGFVCSAQETLIQNLTRHRGILGYQVVDGSPIRVIRRDVNDSLVVDLEVTQPELVRSDGPSIVYERVNPADLPVGVDIHYTDPDQEFDTRTMPARHDGSGVASAIVTVASDYIMTATAVREMAFETLYDRIRSRALRLSYEVKDAEPEVGDIISVSRVASAELVSNPRFLTNSSGYTFEAAATWSAGDIHSEYHTASPTDYPDVLTNVQTVSGTSYVVEIHQTITGDGTFIEFAHNTPASTSLTGSTARFEFVADYTGLDTLYLEFEDLNDAAVRDLTFISMKPANSNLADVFTTLVEQQTYTKSRTNQIIATALLTSQGIIVPGDGGTGVSAGTLWPEDCVSNIGLADGGKFWSEVSSTDLYAVNSIPTPYRKLPKSKAFAISSAIVNAIVDDASYVYYITQTGQIIRVGKTNLTDYTVLETQDTAPVTSPAQAKIQDGSLYFATEGYYSGTRSNWITVVDLSNFTTSGVVHHEYYNGGTELLTPVGICIVAPYIAITTQGGSGGSSLLYGSIASLGSFLTKTTVGNDHSLGFGISDGTYAYFVPNAWTLHETNVLGAQVTLGAGAPTITYFDITDDANVASMAGTQRSYPAIDGANLCFLVIDTDGAPYITRRILAGAAATTGISVVPYLPNSQEASTYSAWYLCFSDGYFYIPGNEYFIEINEASLIGKYFPQQTFLAPTNDNFINAQVITAPSTITASNKQATKEAGESDWGATSNDHSLWHVFTPDSTGDYALEITTADFDAKLAVFTGSAVASLSLVGSVESIATPVVLGLTAGTRYHITVDSKGTGSFVGGQFTMTLAHDGDEDFLMLG